MTPRHIGAWLLRRWPIVGGVLILAAFAAGLLLGSSGSLDIFAQAEPTSVVIEEPTPVATSETPIVITEETMHLLPPFDPNAIPTMVPPPCIERLDRKYDSYPYFTLGYAGDQCSIQLGDRYLTESQADEYVAERNAEERERAQAAPVDEAAAFRAELAEIRSIEFLDGTRVQLPDDVVIDDYLLIDYFCKVGQFCPEYPQYRLVRGDSVVWVDGNGYMMAFSFMGDEPEEIDPSAFPFLTERAPEGCC